MNWKLLTLSALLLVSLSGLGLAQNSDDAHVRVLHLSTDAPAVDILVNGGVALTAVPYQGFSDSIPLPPATYTFSVNLAGTATQVLQEAFTLEATRFYTVLAIGRVDNGSLRLRVLGEDQVDPGPGNDKLRVVHAASTAPEVDAYLTAPYVNLANQVPVLTNVPFSAFTQHLEIPMGLYQGRVTVAGTKTVAIDTGPLRLENGQIRTLVAVDPVEEGGPFRIVVLEDKN